MRTATPFDRAAIVKLVREALHWCDFAAGEGHCREVSGGAYRGPEDFLMEYSDATGEEDWETLPDRLADALDAALTTEPPPPASSGRSEG